MRNYCPYCKADLRSISTHVVGVGFEANCPFCKRTVYGTLGEDGQVGWSRWNPLKVTTFFFVGAIILISIIAFFILK